MESELSFIKQNCSNSKMIMSLNYTEKLPALNSTVLSIHLFAEKSEF